MSAEIVEFVDEVCGLYFRSIVLPHIGTRVSQHTHEYDHATLVGSGAARLYVDGVHEGDYVAGQAIPVRAGKYHAFQSLAPNTRLTCVHNAESALAIKDKGL